MPPVLVGLIFIVPSLSSFILILKLSVYISSPLSESDTGGFNSKKTELFSSNVTTTLLSGVKIVVFCESCPKAMLSTSLTSLFFKSGIIMAIGILVMGGIDNNVSMAGSGLTNPFLRAPFVYSLLSVAKLTSTGSIKESTICSTA